MNSIICIDRRETDVGLVREDEDREIRTDKVLAIRRQLAEGRYRIDERLDAVVDKIFEELVK